MGGHVLEWGERSALRARLNAERRDAERLRERMTGARGVSVFSPTALAVFAERMDRAMSDWRRYAGQFEVR